MNADTSRFTLDVGFNHSTTYTTNQFIIVVSKFVTPTSFSFQLQLFASSLSEQASLRILLTCSSADNKDDTRIPNGIHNLIIAIQFAIASSPSEIILPMMRCDSILSSSSRSLSVGPLSLNDSMTSIQVSSVGITHFIYCFTYFKAWYHLLIHDDRQMIAVLIQKPRRYRLPSLTNSLNQ